MAVQLQNFRVFFLKLMNVHLFAILKSDEPTLSGKEGFLKSGNIRRERWGRRDSIFSWYAGSGQNWLDVRCRRSSSFVIYFLLRRLKRVRNP